METLSWATLKNHIDHGIPFALPLGGSRSAKISFDIHPNRLWISLPANEQLTIGPSPFAEMEVSQRDVKGIRHLEVTVTNPALFSPFHQMAVLTTISFEDPSTTPSDAFNIALESWRNLITRRPLLSDSEQQGLFGELALLLAFLNEFGKDAVMTWVAYSSDVASRHDFRLGDIEIEVKTTRRRRRIHQINGLTQLVASPGHQLYVLSLKYESAGLNAGKSLSEIITKIRLLLASGTSARMDFEAKLQRAKFRDEDLQNYQEALIAAGEPKLLAVDDNFPRIVPELLEAACPNQLSSRIHQITYEVDLEGLGAGPSEAPYRAVLKEIKIDQ
jgi:hypothetical protein